MNRDRSAVISDSLALSLWRVLDLFSPRERSVPCWLPANGAVEIEPRPHRKRGAQPMDKKKTPPYAVAFIVAGLVVLIDQASKAAALAELSESERIPLLGDLLGLQLAFNPGALLSFGSEVTWVLTVLGVGITVTLFVAAKRSRSIWWATGIGFILGGAIGNVLDRLFSPPGFGRGHVTDFLAYGNWFIGNLADIALGVGAVILGLGLWIRRRAASQEPGATSVPAEDAQVYGS